MVEPEHVPKPTGQARDDVVPNWLRQIRNDHIGKTDNSHLTASADFLASRPSIVVAGSLQELIDAWDRLEAAGTPLHEIRSEVSHIGTETGSLRDISEFEEALEEDLPTLSWICNRPTQDLRYDELVQPIARVRRPARGASAQLASHSEQWSRWSPEMPIPKAILAAIREDEINLYENRVVRTLISGAARHIEARLAEVRSYLRKNMMGRDVLLTGWHWRQERLKSVFDASTVESSIGTLEATRVRLEAMAVRLDALRRSVLFNATPAGTWVATLRPNNVLRRDARYRLVPPLWVLWRQTAELDESDLQHLNLPEVTERGMRILTEVLIAKALGWMGFEWQANEGHYQRGNASVFLESGNDALALRTVDSAGERTMQFVAVGIPLVAPDRTHPLATGHIIDQILRDGNHTQQSLCLVHPLDAGDMASLKRPELDLIDHPGVDSPDPQRTWCVVPASPLLIDSIERMTRVVRWQVSAALFDAYPPRADLGEVTDQQRLSLEHIDDTELSGRILAFLAPPDDAISQMAVIRLRKNAGREAAIKSAQRYFDELLNCPVFPTHKATSTSFNARPDGTFLCRCTSCKAEWGIDQCGTCHRRMPFIRPGKAVSDGERPSDFFGGDLLASLCEVPTAADVAPVKGGPDKRVLICPYCRICGRARSFPECKRCWPSES